MDIAATAVDGIITDNYGYEGEEGEDVSALNEPLNILQELLDNRGLDADDVHDLMVHAFEAGFDAAHNPGA